MKDFIKQDFKEFKASDFALEPSFVAWVKKTDREAEDFWAEWLIHNPDKREEIELARSLVFSLQFRGEEITVGKINQEWKKLQNRSKNPERHIWGSFSSSRFSIRMIASAAAVVLLLATFTFIVTEIAPQNPESTQNSQVLTKETPKGQKLSIVLPDGSEIKLNSDSKIQYPSNFSGDFRDVVLEGEAYFEVIHHSEMPFRVHIGEVVVEVLGTSFNVEAYPENPEVRVALVEGKVKVNTPKDTTGSEGILLKPSEMVGINRTDMSHRIQLFDPQEISGWKDGYLFFKRVDFEETIAKLERWYGVEFVRDSTVVIDPHWRFNGKFQNKSLEYILRTFSYPDLFRYRIEDHKVIIYSNQKDMKI